MRHDAGRLVFGDDGSRGADIAWLWINNHPWPDWRVDVLTGADPPYDPSTWGVTPTLEPWTPPWGRTYVGPEKPVAVPFRHADSDPRLVLEEQTDADVVVVGHTGIGHLRSLWLGSTSEWLLHHPTAPLAIIHSAAAVRDVVCCTDGSASASKALATFLMLPLATGTNVTVLSVDDGRADVDVAVSTATTALNAAGIDPHTERVAGKPTHRILEHLQETQPQLVVLGTKGLTGWQRLRLGSTAAAVVHHVPGATLVACA